MANSILSQPHNPHNLPPVVNEYLKTYDRLSERLSKVRSLVAMLQNQDILNFPIQVVFEYLCVLDEYAEGACDILADLDTLQRQWIQLMNSSSGANGTQSESRSSSHHPN